MNAQVDWWLLLVGLAIGAGLAWLVLAEMRRHEDDVTEGERQAEVRWIVDALAASGTASDVADILEVLRLHRTFLASVPPADSTWTDGGPPWVNDEPVEPRGGGADEPRGGGATGSDATRGAGIRDEARPA
ncbi:MAG: hypothetical protein ACYDAK_03485 [Candidatus Limnocylindrales bacterium]